MSSHALDAHLGELVAKKIIYWTDEDTYKFCDTRNDEK